MRFYFKAELCCYYILCTLNGYPEAVVEDYIQDTTPKHDTVFGYRLDPVKLFMPMSASKMSIKNDYSMYYSFDYRGSIKGLRYQSEAHNKSAGQNQTINPSS